jgi:flagellar protein FliO/FliZ
MALAFWPVGAAAESGAAQALPETDFGGALVTMLAGLALVLGLMVGLYWLLRRFLPGVATGGVAGGGLKLLGRLPLAPRKYVALIEVADRVLVVGVSEQGVNLLTTLEDRDLVEDIKQAGGGQSFARMFKRAAQREEEP